jgi:protein-S-isoprenylcysteine O-methyltransferase Ste14
LHWSLPVPAAIQILGLCGFFVGFWFTLRAMSSNRFFSSVIRIQSERGHHVIDSGPYRVIRHPGYLGMLLTVTMLPLALGSWWAFVPAGLYDALILRRILQEDRFLQDQLPGYSAYAGRVTRRIVPGIW